MELKKKRPSLIFVETAMLILFAVLIIGVNLLIADNSLKTGVIRDDVVRSSTGTLYRRVVRVDRDWRRKEVTTTVSFTDNSNGGVGSASYTQPAQPRDSRLSPLLRIIGARLGFLKMSDRPREFPLMSIPEPIEPGKKWKVRMVLMPHGSWTQGSGDHPKDAGLYVMPSSLAAGANTDTYYGQGVTW
jgi:hypothetical protein